MFAPHWRCDRSHPILSVAAHFDAKYDDARFRTCSSNCKKLKSVRIWAMTYCIFDQRVLHRHAQGKPIAILGKIVNETLFPSCTWGK
jgi:hypothetical protein